MGVFRRTQTPTHAQNMITPTKMMRIFTSTVGPRSKNTAADPAGYPEISFRNPQHPSPRYPSRRLRCILPYCHYWRSALLLAAILSVSSVSARPPSQITVSGCGTKAANGLYELQDTPGIFDFCRRCRGSGLVKIDYDDDICPDCRGRGKHVTKPSPLSYLSVDRWLHRIRVPCQKQKHQLAQYHYNTSVCKDCQYSPWYKKKASREDDGYGYFIYCHYFPESRERQCSACGGTGKVTRAKRDGTVMVRPRKCHTCEGTGRVRPKQLQWYICPREQDFWGHRAGFSDQILYMVNVFSTDFTDLSVLPPKNGWEKKYGVAPMPTLEWTLCEACNDTGSEPCDKADCTNKDRLHACWNPMGQCTRPCPCGKQKETRRLLPADEAGLFQAPTLAERRRLADSVETWEIHLSLFLAVVLFSMFTIMKRTFDEGPGLRY